MSRRTLVIGVAVIAGPILLYVVGDALVVSDEEKLGELVDLATTTVGPETVTAALAWTDLAAEPLELNGLGAERLYRPGDEERLAADARSALSPLYGDDLSALGSRTEVERGQASIWLRLFSSRGLRELDLSLRRHGERWVVYRVNVR
jgi:hypothetical protein